MDLSELVPGERMIEIKHPKTGEDIGVRVGLVSYDDERMKKVKRHIRDRKLHLEARGKTFKAEEIDTNRITLLFNAMTGWEWYGEKTNFRGTKPDFNLKSVTEVFTLLEWFMDQIDEAVGDEKAFF